ncbi:hypothetical protein [Lactococcus petauri]|uniref:hypothetical protein n=1 Tax=Lactococcus petauri TaxID=1940789 RepID=UPI0022E0EEEA|nr:hypothetical protein [Lactococcus petauri]
MISNLLNKKRYTWGILGILFFYLAITLILWERLPDEIFLPLRFDIFRSVGFYPKTIENVAFVFITTVIGSFAMQIAIAVLSIGKIDLFSLMIISKFVDLFGWLVAIAFFVCSFANNGFYLVIFYLAGAMILSREFLKLKFVYKSQEKNTYKKNRD